MLEIFTDKLSNFIEILLILGGFVALYFKDKNKNEVDNLAQTKDISTIKINCDKCQDENSKQFMQIESRIEKIERKQSSDNKGIYDKLDSVEQRLGSRLDANFKETIKLLTDILKQNK